jgi:hypothetical protein
MIQDKRKLESPNEGGTGLEEFRRELEARLEIEKTKMRKDQEDAIARIGQLSVNSITQAEAEWVNYEKLLESAREELYRRSRDEMSRLFSESSSSAGVEDYVSRVMTRILPVHDMEEEKTGGSKK